MISVARENVEQHRRDIREKILFDETKLVLDHWMDLAKEAFPALPHRTSVEPAAMMRSLTRLFLIRLEPDTGALRYRLAGEEVNSRYNHTIRGRTLDEITDAEARPRVDAYFRTCPTRPALILLSGVLFSERQEPGYGERLLLPLADGRQGEERGILGITYQSRIFKEWDSHPDRKKRLLRTYPLNGDNVDVTDVTGV